MSNVSILFILKRSLPLFGFNKSLSFASHTFVRHKKSRIDKSKVPVINEKDLEEQFIHGSGPGGTNVNKLTNCCLLIHLPTGIVVKSHESRLLHENRKYAREKLREKLDILYNGDDSVTAQKKRLFNSKENYKDIKAQRLRELKRQFKIKEELIKQNQLENTE